MASWWRRVFLPTDIPNTYEGGWCWVHAKVRPRWYWLWRRVCLFVAIVWRRVDSDPRCTRLDWRTAWSVSSVANGLTADSPQVRAADRRRQDKAATQEAER
jgi:hypothetical protein